ncbi:MAG: hypothetical protein NT159_11185 [Proteobacteria bacterium]|nr:hypothetical protein [Pseudomonadota bacterium]
MNAQRMNMECYSAKIGSQAKMMWQRNCGSPEHRIDDEVYMPTFQMLKTQTDSRNRFLVAVVLWSICTSVFSADDLWTLGFDGIGPLKIGMRFDEVNRLVGNTLGRTDPGLRASPRCEQIPLETRPGIALMFFDDILQRVDVYKKNGQAGGRTERGVNIGDPISRVLDVYRNVIMDHREYVEEEYSLTVRSANGKRAIRFLTYEGKIEIFYGGEFGAVNLMEGCT